MRPTAQQIEIAADWWTAQIHAPQFKALAPHERSEPGNGPMVLAEVLATMAAAKAPTVTDEQAATFRSALIEEMTADPYLRSVFVDYDPDRYLAAAARKAGLSTGPTAFPWKTRLEFDADGGVSVACGYGAKFTRIHEPTGEANHV